VLEPVTGKQLTLQFKLALLTVRANEPVKYAPLDVSRAQPLTIEQDFTFGKISSSIRSANWTGDTLELTLYSVEQNGLQIKCPYLYTDPIWVSAGGYDICDPANLYERITLGPFPDPSQPPPVYIAADIQFTEPFEFVWVRTDIP
jgi:hypothetical protein